MAHKKENFQTVTDDQFNHFRFHRDSRKRSRKVYDVNVPAFSYKMSITTFQKVTLVSCIVLCISLFLPKMMLYGVKKEMMQKTGKGIIHPASPDVPSHFPAFPDLSFDVGSCCLTHLLNNLPSPTSLKFQKTVPYSTHCKTCGPPSLLPLT